MVLLVGADANAGTLTNATWLQAFSDRFAVFPIPMTRTFVQLGAFGMSTFNSISVSLSYPPLATTLFYPKVCCTQPIDAAIQITQGGAQEITATPGMAAGTPGISGTVLIMSAVHQLMGVNQSMFKVGTNTALFVPVSVGKAGQFTGAFAVVGVPHHITVDFYAWTPGTIAFTGLTSEYAPRSDVTAAGSFGLTAKGGGTVALVSPSKVSIDGSLLQRRTISYVTLRLAFVPEPGALLLLGAGFVALVYGARRRAR
jgi:hypothetical protein